MDRTVVIDCFPESVARWRDDHAVVAIDVVRATTTAITCVVLGRRCFLAGSVEEAFELARSLDNPLLVGEVRGVMPRGFDINNSPSALTARTDIHRPAVLLSSTGTRLCLAAQHSVAAFPACLRNYRAVASHLARSFAKVAVIGAGTRDEFREEDQMCCAWIAGVLMDSGYRPKDKATQDIVERWRGAGANAWIGGKSEAYLRNSGQLDDLDFVLDHVDDLRAVFSMRRGEVVMEPAAVPEAAREKELEHV